MKVANSTSNHKIAQWYEKRVYQIQYVAHPFFLFLYYSFKKMTYLSSRMTVYLVILFRFAVR